MRRTVILLLFLFCTKAAMTLLPPLLHTVDGKKEEENPTGKHLVLENNSAWGRRGREEPGTFEKPRSVAVDDEGRVSVLDVSGRIQRFDPSGSYLDSYPIPGVAAGNPQSIAPGGRGTLLVADTHNNRILRLNADGEFLPVIDASASAPDSAKPGELFWPCAVVETPGGSIYTLEYGGHDRVQKWRSDGTWNASWGCYGTGTGEFRRPSGIAVGRNGEVYVSDSVNNRIQVFTADGTWLRAWDASDSPHGRLACPFDVAVLESGLVAVLEYAASRLRLFSADGEEVFSWGGHSRETDGLLYPWGMTVGTGNSVFIADTLNHRIIKLDLNVR